MPSTSQQQLLSDEVQEIISYRPGLVIRKGNIIFLLVLLFIFSLAFIIRYPDVVKASVRIAASNAPKMIASKAEGRLEKLFVVNGEHVKKGQLLAYLQTTAKQEQVMRLQQWISEAEPLAASGKIDVLVTNPLPLLNELGELQTAYESFQNNVQEINEVLSNGFYQKKKQALLKDIQYQEMLRQNLKNQKSLQQKDYALQQIEYNANKKLVDEKVIAPLEFNQNKSKLFAKEQSLQQMSSQLISNDLVKNSKNKELLELQKYVVDLVRKFQSELMVLKNKMAQWEETYIINSPEEGILEFLASIQENQLLNSGQELFYVQPPGSRYYADMRAGQSNLGKLKSNQAVLIRLESYPSEEYGYIRGTINHISGMPNARDSFIINVELPEGLKTNYNKEIFFRNNLLASAEIITDDRLLAERFFGQVMTMLKR
ncbi:MAG TPA: HlyD family efflux transporter periplasmic adaptor subunit [Ferruginibacter sp.]|nr:HlyD family efflux transporter periplasmic adaptor subunit [Ferruginibacter sp.]